MTRLIALLITIIAHTPISGNLSTNPVQHTHNVSAESCFWTTKSIHIVDDINLKGETWHLPRKSCLVFEGGSIKNGRIVFSESTIEASDGNRPAFYDVTFSGRLKSAISPTWFHYSRVNNTELLQSCINSSKEVDLQGGAFKVNKLVLRPGVTIKNGKLEFENVDYCLYGVGVKGITINDITINGGGSSGCAIFISDSKNVSLENVGILQIYSEEDAAAGVYLRRCTNSKIIGCHINDVVAKPNGKVGDSKGASRAIILQHCFDVTVSQNEIGRIISSEDGDGIHIINEADDKTGNILICNNVLKDCSRRHIKVQAPGVHILGNQLLTDIDTYHLDYTITLFSSNCRIDGNTFKASSSVPIQIGGGGVGLLERIVVTNNTIIDSGNGNQGSVTITSPVKDIEISGNDITLLDDNECSVYVRNECKNLRVYNNKQDGGRGLVFIREQQRGTEIQGIDIADNIVKTSGYFFALSVISEDDPVSKITIKRNKVAVDNLTYQGDAVFVVPISACLRNQISIKDNVIAESISFNRRVKGVSSLRPTSLLNNDNKGYRYYDESLGREIIWNGIGWD